MIAADDEKRRSLTQPGFSDGVEVAFGDGQAAIFVTARISITAAKAHDGVSPAAPALATVLVVVFSGGDVAEVLAQGEIAIDSEELSELEVAGLRFETVEPLRTWRVSFNGERVSFDVELEATTQPCEAGPNSEIARGGGLEGYEQICRVSGKATVAAEVHEIACLGQRGHSWGVADWTKIQLARSVGAWIAGDDAVLLSAVRSTEAVGHAQEATTAWVIKAADEVAAAVVVEDPRLSTSYDSDGRQRRAALELWEKGDCDRPQRASGLLLCGTTLYLGSPESQAALRMECAFFLWRMNGRSGIGRYALIRRL